MSATKTMTGVRLPATLVERLDQVAEVTERSRNWLIRKSVEEYLEREAWVVEAIQAGVKAADQGHFATAKDVGKAFAHWGVNAKE